MSIRKRLASFRYAFKGLIDLIQHTPNARIHLAATIGVSLVAWYFDISRMEWCWLLACMALVWMAEALNTALEYLTDLVSPDYHPLAGKAKDVAAAAVLIAAIFAVLIGTIIILPYLL